MSSTKANLKIGIVWKSGIEASWLRLFYSFGYPEFITPGKASKGFDVIIIPDGVSAYIGMNCFKPNIYKAIGLQPLDLAVEMFRTEPRGLAFYIEHGIPIIGIGEGRVMLWDYLGNKCSLRGEKESTIVELIKEGCNGEIIRSNDTHVIEFQCKNLFGVESLYSPLLRNILRDIQEEVTKEIQAIKAPQGKGTFLLGSF